jgi:hypothetical protein
MSAEATGWAFRHSPFTGAAFAVHLALADSVNDQHHHEFWLEQGKLAVKARVARQTANEALGQLLGGGFVVDLGELPGKRGVRRYRFMFPDAPVVYETRRALSPVAPDDTSASAPVASDDKSGPAPVVQGDSTCRPGRQHLSSTTTQNPKNRKNPKSGAASGAPPAEPAPLQQLVAHFVDESRKAGSEPTSRVKGHLATQIGRLLREGKDPAALRVAVRICAEEGKPPGHLDYVLGDYERWRASKEARR